MLTGADRSAGEMGSVSAGHASRDGVESTLLAGLAGGSAPHPRQRRLPAAPNDTVAAVEVNTPLGGSTRGVIGEGKGTAVRHGLAPAAPRCGSPRGGSAAALSATGAGQMRASALPRPFCCGRWCTLARLLTGPTTLGALAAGGGAAASATSALPTGMTTGVVPRGGTSCRRARWSPAPPRVALRVTWRRARRGTRRSGRCCAMARATGRRCRSAPAGWALAATSVGRRPALAPAKIGRYSP